ncbi:MAG: ATP-dependent DNA ligase [Candidatus Hodarchaeales archaeon]
MQRFNEFCQVMDEVTATSRRKEKAALVAEMLLKATADQELAAICYFSIGIVSPKIKIGAGWRTVSRIIGDLSALSSAEIQKRYKQDADFGRMVEFALSSRKADLGQFLITKKPKKQPTILEIHSALIELSTMKGKGSTKRRIDAIRRIFIDLSPLESKYVARFLTEDIRTGFRMGMLDETIAVAYDIPGTLVRRARMLLGDPGEVAILAKEGEAALKAVQIMLFRPVGPMLAEKVDNFPEAFEQHNQRAVIEPKLDGLRAQIHVDGEGEARIYSRLLKDITASFPELVEAMRVLHCHSIILDGEIVAFVDGKQVFFQDLVKRKRKHESEEHAERIPSEYYAFDILLHKEQQLIDDPYSHRREILATVVPREGKIRLMESHEVKEVDRIKHFYETFLEQGYEGAMIKSLDGPYLAGRRGKYWLKLKQEMELDLVIVGAERGHGRRTGWLSDYLLAAYDEESAEFVVVGKTFKGLTDAEFQEMTRILEEIIVRDEGWGVTVTPEFQEMTRILEEIIVRDEGWGVTVTPKIVVKCIFEGIQASTRYQSGLALRFARIAEIRYDKGPDEVNRLQTVRKIFENQFKTQARAQ